MKKPDLPTRERIMLSAARLFRQKGYHGVGLTEILAASQAPKGSLYHHFPNGKADLARAAANWASDGMARIVDDAFVDADSFDDGIVTLCHKLAKFFDLSNHQDGCPVSVLLFDEPGDEDFRDFVSGVFDRWINVMATHGERLGLDRATALQRSESFLIFIQGAWVMARARRSSDVLRSIPARIAGGNV